MPRKASQNLKTGRNFNFTIENAAGMHVMHVKGQPQRLATGPEVTMWHYIHHVLDKQMQEKLDAPQEAK